MSAVLGETPSLRVIAYNSAYVGKLPCVNVVASDADTQTTARNSKKTVAQLTAAQTTVGTHKTVMAAPSMTKGLPTIVIAGYSGPE